MKAQIIETGEVISVVKVITTTNNDTIYRNIATGKDYYDRDIQIFDDSGVMEFVEMWLLNYYHSDMVGWIDDLHCALDNECDDEKLARIEESWGTDPKGWLIELINLESAAYRRALERYYALMYPKINI